MKKVLFLLSVFAVFSATAQTPVSPTTFNNVKIVSPVVGSKSDSVVVWRGSDKILRYVPLSLFSPSHWTKTGNDIFNNNTGKVIFKTPFQFKDQGVAGSVLMTNNDIDHFRFVYTDPGTPSQGRFYMSPTSFFLGAFDTATLAQSSLYGASNGEGVIVSGLPTSKGLQGAYDFSGNNDGSDRRPYTQIGWVKDYVTGLGYGTVSNVSGTDGINVASETTTPVLSLGDITPDNINTAGNLDVGGIANFNTDVNITGGLLYVDNNTNITGTVTAGGGFMGSLIGNVIGNVTGNLTGSLVTAGNVQIGATSETGFNMFSEVDGNINNERRRLASNTSTHSVGSNHQRSRGTLAAKTAVLANDRIGVYSFAGYDGSAFQNSARWIVSANENFTPTAQGSKMVFETAKLGTAADYPSFEIAGDLTTVHGNMIVDYPPTISTHAVRKLELDTKQNTLVSGTTLKTVGGNSLLGSGDIPITTPTEYAETAYAQTIAFTAGTAPSGTFTGNWQATQVGKRVTLRINFKYATPGSTVTIAMIPWPTGAPLPAEPTGFTTVNDFYGMGVGSFSTATNVNTTARAAIRKTAGNPEIYLTGASASLAVGMLTLDYWVP